MDKDYVDCGVQTSPPRLIAQTSEFSFSPGSGSSVPRVFDIDNGCQSLSPNSTQISPSSSQPDSAYSHSFHHHDSDSSGPVRSTAIARRQHLPYNRPQGPRKSEKRVVSLPEIGSSPPSVTALINETAARVVSLAERPKPHVLHNSPSPIRFRSPTFKNSLFFTGSEDNSRSRNHTSTSDVPHTPSPPSSPESSVLIIDNDAQLPRTFLRKKSTLDSHLEYSDDDGWITWASSPPRPIPALHGPLSLPYARCPSGAEGTILEGPETLPGMIWGLGAEDLPATRTPAIPEEHPESPSMSMSQLPPRNFPPRFLKAQTQPVHNLPLPPLRAALSVASRPTLATSESDRRTQAALHQRALETLGSRHPRDVNSSAVTLNHMLRTGAAKVTGTWASSSLNGAKGDIGQDHHTNDMAGSDVIGLGLDWQSALAYQTLRGDIIGSGRDTKRADHLKSSAPPFIPAGRATQPQYPRIFIEPRSTTSSQNAPPRRPSAFEIAQQYRQQQQAQSALPTPPSSSSPQWSPYFSAYQDSLSLSSVPTSRPPISLLVQSQVDQCSAGDSCRELRRFLDDRIGKLASTNNSRRLVTPTKAVQVPKALPQPATQQHPGASISLSKYLRHRSFLSSQSPNLSPSQPGPPPNSPLPPIPDHGIKHNLMPLSPTSPEPRIRSLSSHKPRSIPLARLIQRRLSSVPEEDINSMVELNRSPSPVGLKQKPSDYFSSPALVLSPPQVPSRGQHLPAPPTSMPRTPSPVPETLTPLSKFGGESLSVESHVAQVKLPQNSNFGSVNGSLSGRGKVHGKAVKDVGAGVVRESKENLLRGVEGTALGNAPKKKGRAKKPRIPANAVAVVRV